MKHETAGDPVSGCKWSRRSTTKISRQLKRLRIRVSARTVAKLLKDNMGYSLRVNLKTIESGSKKRDPEKRDKQFHYIKRQCRDYVNRNLPIISIDSKSRELIGQFHHKGKVWSNRSIKVFDHDFPSDAKGIGLTYGIYDYICNKGFVSVGISHDTAQFAVDSIRTWWFKEGRYGYPDADEILILADCGGSNSYRTALWKYQLQVGFCDKTGLKARVCHYPSGASKWNPIEHRMFSFISINWEGKPLDSYETMLKYIRSTKTEEGLRIRACMNTKQYVTGIKPSKKQMASIQLKRYRVNTEWNYSITPSKM
jgi:hypothetical protein